MTGIEIFIADLIVMNTAVDIVVAHAIASIAVDVAVALGVSAISSALFKSGSDQARELTQMIRLSDAPHKFLYGTRLVGGLIAYIKESADHQYLYIILVLAAHEVNAIGDVYFNDKPATDYDASYYTVTKHLGTASQAADTTFVTDLTEWTSAHQLKGRAYLAVKLKGSRTVWPTGIPLIRAVVQGKKVYDPRDLSTAFSNNPALCIRDYLLTAKESGGFGAESTEVDDDYFETAANICDESVTVPTGAIPDSAAITGATQANPVVITATAHPFINGQAVEIDAVGGMTELNGNTYTVANATANTFELSGIDGTGYGAYTSGGTATEPVATTTQTRFALDGSVDTSLQPTEILRTMLTSCRGMLVYVSGQYRLFVGAYNAPSHTITDDDLRAAFTAQASMPRKELYNGVRGRFANPVEKYQYTDFPPYQDSTYVTADGGDEIWRDVEYPYTIDVYRAQRLSKLEVMKSRRGRVVQLPCKLTALNVAVWDTVTLDLDACPEIDGVYRVEAFEFAVDAGGLGIDLVLREEASADYSWTYDEAVIPVPPTDISTSTLSTAPTPANLSANDDSIDENYVSVVLSWDAETFDGEMIAEVSRWDDVDSVWYNEPTAFMVSGQTPTVVVTGLVPSRDYTFRVVHRWSLAASPSTAATVDHTTGTLAAPGVPGNLATANGTSGRIAVSWDESTDNGSFVIYRVEWRLISPITGATQANPVVITSTAHPFINGQSVDIDSVGGMTEINDLSFTVANAATNTFELSGVNGTGYTAYTSGGEVAPTTYNKKFSISTDYTITGLTTGATYDIRVRGQYLNGSASAWTSTTHTAP